MENKLALVNKQTKRVENIIIVASFDDALNWETSLLDAVPIQTNQTAYLYGKYENNKFSIPENEYLIEIGIVRPEVEESNAETL